MIIKIIKCHFCQKEYKQEWTPTGNGGQSMPLLFVCKEHTPEIIFSSKNHFTMMYNGLIISVDIVKNMLEIITYIKIDDQGRAKKTILMTHNLPQTRDLQVFTNFIDRLLSLQAFS